MANCYIDVLDYQRASTGMESASLVANITRLSILHAVGATTLTVGLPLETPLSAYDRVTVFDGPNSEVVVVASTVQPGAISIPLLAGLVFQHAAGVLLCSDGISGSLADMVFNASTILENIAKQPLWQTTQDETLPMPSIKASLSNQGLLTFKPRQYPITVINSLSIQMGISSTSFNPAYAFITGDRETVTMSQLLATGNPNANLFSAFPISRSAQGWLQINYTAGYAQGALPADVRMACTYLVSDLLAMRNNPTGAAEISQGKKHLVTALRGDQSGESQLKKLAIAILNNYTVRPY